MKMERGIHKFINGYPLEGTIHFLTIVPYLVCYWTVVDLRMSMVDLARKFGITPGVVSYAVERGGKIAKEGGHRLGA